MISSILATVLSVALATVFPQWHNPASEKTNAPSEQCWTYSGSNIDFSTNATAITVRYILESAKVPSGATEMAACGVDLFDIDNDGGFHLLDGKCNLGNVAGDTLKFEYSVSYGKASKFGNEFRLYLPLYNKVKWMEIGTEGGDSFVFEPVPAEKPLALYSVPVEKVSRPAEAVRNILQRKLDFPVVVIPRCGHRKFSCLMAVRGKDADTIATVKAVYRKLGLPDSLPDILVPVRQRRDMNFYDWAQRHAQVLYRERVTAPDPEVLLIGNSITHYWAGEPFNSWHAGVEAWNGLFGTMNVTNLGFGWDRLGNMMWRVMHEEMDGFSAKHIFIMAGTNDIKLRPEEEVAKGVAGLAAYIRFKQPSARIHIVHIYPRRGLIDRVDQINSLIDNELKVHPIDNLDIVDVKSVLVKEDGTLDESLFRDGLHPNETGYKRIADVYRKFLY